MQTHNATFFILLFPSPLFPASFIGHFQFSFSVLPRADPRTLYYLFGQIEPHMRMRRRVRRAKKQRARMRSLGSLHVSLTNAMMHVHIDETRTRRVNKQTNKPHSASRGLFREFCSSHIHFWDWLLRQLSIRSLDPRTLFTAGASRRETVLSIGDAEGYRNETWSEKRLYHNGKDSETTGTIKKERRKNESERPRIDRFILGRKKN